MAMAVLIAPLVEETSSAAISIRSSRNPSALFRHFAYGSPLGLMHGSQLGWTWGIVGLLILVGIIFTSHAHTPAPCWPASSSTSATTR